MSVHKNNSQFESTDFLLVNDQILIDFFALKFQGKDAFNLGTFLIDFYSTLTTILSGSAELF